MENRLAVEALVASCLERIAAREPVVRAFVQYDPDAALLAARRLDSASRKGLRCADRGKRPDRALLCRWRRLWKSARSGTRARASRRNGGYTSEATARDVYGLTD
jgi:hypothetical protein